MGIGAIPNAVLSQLSGHKNLGIHTEMFADGVIPLVEKGVINGANKAIDRGKMVADVSSGIEKIILLRAPQRRGADEDVGYTNDPFILSRNPKVTRSIPRWQVDLTGQILRRLPWERNATRRGRPDRFLLRRVALGGRQGHLWPCRRRRTRK
jgi:acyl-CoA hydrolase